MAYKMKDQRVKVVINRKTNESADKSDDRGADGVHQRSPPPGLSTQAESALNRLFQQQGMPRCESFT